MSSEHQLILLPSDDGSIAGDVSGHIIFERYARFIAAFQKLPGENISQTYRYGELRLSGLSMCARMCLGKLTFHHMDAQRNVYPGRFLALLFRFLQYFLSFWVQRKQGLAYRALCRTNYQNRSPLLKFQDVPHVRYFYFRGYNYLFCSAVGIHGIA